MVRKILCKKCETEGKNLFPTESPYPGEHVKFIEGTARGPMICDDCGKNILADDEVCAFSIFTDFRGIQYYTWEFEYINIKEDTK